MKALDLDQLLGLMPFLSPMIFIGIQFSWDFCLLTWAVYLSVLTDQAWLKMYSFDSCDGF